MKLVFHILGALVGLALVAGTAKAILDVGARNSFVVDASYSGVSRLVVDQQNGAVRLVGVPAGRRLAVSARVKEGLDSPTRRAVRRGTTLELEAKCGSAASDHCRVDYTIQVPAGTMVRVASGNGPIVANGLSAPAVTLRSGTAPVTASGMSARTLTATSATGPVEVGMDRPARLLRAESATGPLLLTVPDVPYALDVSSASGGLSVSAGLRRDPSSRYRISADSAAAPIEIDVRR